MKIALRTAAMLFPVMALSATAAYAATVFTDETIQDARVISQLDLTDLAPGKMHRFMFLGAETATGQYWYVPVLVTKGQKIAIQRNGFGDIVHEYVAPADGRVAIIGTDAATERGSRIASILVKRASCADGQCDYDGIVP